MDGHPILLGLKTAATVDCYVVCRLQRLPPNLHSQAPYPPSSGWKKGPLQITVSASFPSFQRKEKAGRYNDLIFKIRETVAVGTIDGKKQLIFMTWRLPPRHLFIRPAHWP
jgi:hypothetical protein